MSTIDVIALFILAIFWMLWLIYEEVRAIRFAAEDAAHERRLAAGSEPL